MGCWFVIGCKLLIVEDLIVGVDVGVKVDIYWLIVWVLEVGFVVVVVFIDFEEIVYICYCVFVFLCGIIVSEL